MLVRALVVVLSAFLISSLVAPWGWAFLHWGAYLPLFWALREETPRANRWLLLLYGTVAEGLIFSWITDTIALFSNIPWVGAVAINGLFALVFGLPYFFTFSMLHPIRRRLGDLWIVVLPAWLVVVEWLAVSVILFPYNQGVSQYRTPVVWQLASVTGIWGVSYLMLFFNAAFGEWIYRAREGRPPPWRWMGAALATLAAVVTFGSWRYARIEATLAAAPVRHVEQVQTPWTMVDRLRKPRNEVFSYWVDRARSLPAGAADLVVWPEGSCPYQLNESLVTVQLWQLAERGGFDLIVGAGTREREPDPDAGEKERQRIFNSVYGFMRDALKVDEPGLTPVADWERLAAGGCDLDAAHVWLPYEAAALAAEGGRLGADMACVGKLRERERALREAMKVDPAFEARMALDPGVWPALRTRTARFSRTSDALPLVEAAFDRSKQRGAGWWVVRDAACVDRDCRSITVWCEDTGACDVVPEAPHYDKIVPLPFGEYLPLADTFPWLATLIEGPGDFRAGDQAVLFESGGIRMATPICYEGILGYVCRLFEKPDLIVNVTNDAWFGQTAASDLHGMLVAVRAMELGVPVFRSAYSGVSFVVEPHGRIYAETPLFTDVDRVVDVRLATVDTLYGRLGDWFVWLSMVVVGVAAALSRRPS
ncbi:MAG TPA: nitrilase-related carbon-nitrogen hydrolase [Myxococcota bacterium]|nr:nitrilase-related carbon-nitrogen hydrolase [Myxococcota bacterium]